MAREVGVGVIGMGWMGQVHSRSYRTIQDRFWDSEIQPRLVICADEVESRALQSCSRFGFAEHTTDWQKVIDHPAVDVVNVTSPNFLHKRMVTAAAEAGKHVLCEKPVGQNPQETAQIAAVAERAGVLSFVGFNYRWAPLVQYARQLVNDGKLGTLTHYRGRFLVGYAANPDAVLSWRFDRDLAGLGALGDLMSHVVDMAHSLAGPIARVVGNRHTFIAERPLATPGEGTHFSVGGSGGPRGQVTNEDYVSALVQFANGAQGTFEVDRILSGSKCQMAFELHGTRGALSWDFERMNELMLHLPGEGEVELEADGYSRITSGPQHPHHERFAPGPGVGLSYDDLKAIEAFQFLQSIHNGELGEPSLGDALEVARVQAAIIRSWDRGGWEGIGEIP